MLATFRLATLPVAVVVALGVVFATAEQAGAHAAFVGASPAPGARAEVAPRDVQLRFTEPLNRRLTSVQLIAVGSGKRVAAGLRSVGGSRVVLRPVRALGTSAYRVDWHTVSTLDGHALEGTFSFGVRVDAAGGALVIEQSPLARDGWLRVVMRVLLYAMTLLFVAGMLLPRLVAGAPSWLAPAALGNGDVVAGVRRRASSIVECVGWLAVVAAVGTILAETADAAGSLTPTRLGDYLLANEAGVARLAVAGLLGVAALGWRRLPRLAVAAGVLALGAIAASGHASSASPRTLSVLNDWLHLLGAAVWLGGITLVMLAWWGALRGGGRALRTGVARHVLAPFGRIALPAFLLVTTTGLVSLLTQLGHISALWETSYGRVLTVKVAIVALIAAASAMHALRLRPRLLAAEAGPGPQRGERRHWRLVRAEPWLSLGVVTAVGLLAVFPLPPRQLREADAAQAAGPTCRPCPLPLPAASELPVATQAGSHLVAAWIRRTPAALTGTLRVLDIRGRPSRAPLRVTRAAQTGCGPGCVRFRAPTTRSALAITVTEEGRAYAASLPARWRAQDNRRARRLLIDAQSAMRHLRSVHQADEVTSGPGSYASTAYRLQAPDRMEFRTNGGVRTVIAGRRQWFRAPGTTWQRTDYGSGLPFRTRNWFRWSTYGRSVRLLDSDSRVARLALFDEGTPVWFRLTIDLATLRVVRQQMIARGHFMTTRFGAFDQPVTIKLPVSPRGR